MFFIWALWTSPLFIIVHAELEFAEPQLSDGLDSSSSSVNSPGDWYPEGNDLTASGSGMLGDLYLNSDEPDGLTSNDLSLPSSSDSFSLLPPLSSLDSVGTLFAQDDLFAGGIAAADCSFSSFRSKNKFRPRQECMQTPQISPEPETPQKDDDSKEIHFPENLGIFEPYDPSAYGEMDDDACPPDRFGDKIYSVCDTGQRGDLLDIDPSGYVTLKLCKPGTSIQPPSGGGCIESANNFTFSFSEKIYRLFRSIMAMVL